MSSPERAARLLAAAKDRHDDARRRAVGALRDLDAADLDAAGARSASPASARAAGDSRSWLYRQSDLRTTIEHLRQTRPNPRRHSTPAAQRATTASPDRQLEALRARYVELRAENCQLREALARKLGQHRTDPPADR